MTAVTTRMGLCGYADDVVTGEQCRPERLRRNHTRACTCTYLHAHAKPGHAGKRARDGEPGIASIQLMRIDPLMDGARVRCPEISRCDVWCGDACVEYTRT